MNPDILQFRYNSARIFLSTLVKYSKLEWTELYEMYLSGELKLEELMCLVHPVHFRDRVSQNVIQGVRKFASESCLSTMQCQSSKIWGYACESVNDGNQLVADHYYPYSLGGPTTAANKLYLCRFHNELKTCDIHIFPWENGEPSWLRSQIDRINYLQNK